MQRLGKPVTYQDIGKLVSAPTFEESEVVSARESHALRHSPSRHCSFPAQSLHGTTAGGTQRALSQRSWS